MIEELDEREIDEFLRSQVVGRVACHADGRTYVVPVIYAWDGEAVYVYSVEGRKTEMMRANPEVCFEVDEYLAGGSWRSVIVDGVYEELEGDAAAKVMTLLVERFVGSRRQRDRGSGRKAVAFRIVSTSATGRRVVRTPAHRLLTRAGIALLRRRAAI